MALRLTSNFVRNILASTYRPQNLKSLNYCVSRNLSTKLLLPRSSLTLAQLSSYSNAQRSAGTSLSDFLKKEIELEKEVSKKHTVRKIEGFEMKLENANVILSKSHDGEKITVKFNVNESASQEMDSFAEPPKAGEEDQAPKIVAKPPFQVEVEKNNQRLLFECAFAEDEHFDDEGPQAHDPDEIMDKFHIEMVFFSNGEVTEQTYGSAGSVLDGELYDQLMDYLDERGINTKFADDLVQFATYYEHSLYVNLLQSIRSFASHK